MIMVIKGNGKAIHKGRVASDGGLATRCDGWGSSGIRATRIREVKAAAVTCKSCLKWEWSQK